MSTLQQIAMLIGAIKGFENGAKELNVVYKFKWIPSPILLLMSIISFIIEIFIHIFMAYKFPLLYISWFCLQDPFCIRQLTKLYNKIKK